MIKKNEGRKYLRHLSWIIPYSKFMESLKYRITDAHWEAFGNWSFRQCLKLGPLSVDRATLEKVVQVKDETTYKFFKEGMLAFTLSWIQGHTLLRENGHTVQKNNVEETPMWIKYFKEKPWIRRGWECGGKFKEWKQATVSLLPLHFVQALKHFVHFL